MLIGLIYLIHADFYLVTHFTQTTKIRTVLRIAQKAYFEILF